MYKKHKYNIKKYDDIPLSLYQYLTPYARNKSYTIVVKKNKKVIFQARYYYLTKNFKKERNYPENVKYELGDVYLSEKCRGKKDKKLNKKYSNICFDLILQKNTILWTTKDNIKAIKLYQKYGFKNINIKSNWLQKVFCKDNPWIKSKKIIYFIN